MGSLATLSQLPSAMLGGALLVALLLATARGVPITSKFKEHLTREYTSQDGRKVFVLDGAIPDESVIALKAYSSVSENWRFVLFDEHMTSDENEYENKNGIPWKSWHDPARLQTTKLGIELKNLVEAANLEIHNGSYLLFEMNEAYSALLRRGDRTRVHQEEVWGEKSYSLVIYNNVVWRKNSYGEALFYDLEEEVFAVVTPKFGRVVIWDSSITYILRPPSIAQLSCQSIFLASFSANGMRNKEKRVHAHGLLSDVDISSKEFPCTEHMSQVVELDISKHLSLLRKNRQGQIVAVFDALFPESDLNALRTWTIKHGRYYFDDSLDLDSDNVQWIAGINVHDFVKSSFWPIVLQAANYLSGKNTWYPYDVACNLIRSTDHTRFHRDTSGPMQEEMTFLLYLSPNWSANDYGETAFMETNDDSDENEYIAEVVPLYGRAVLFDGNFPHSARPPSVTHYGPRYTFAVKLAATKLEALNKMFEEEPRHEEHCIRNIQLMNETAQNPKVMSALHKIQSVAYYLEIKEVQRQLSKAVSIEGREESHHEDLEEIDSESTGKDEEIESEDELLPTVHDTLLEMAKHHGVEDILDLGKVTPENIDAWEHPVFNLQSRKKTIDRWKEMSGEDVDVLNSYLELYLKQREEIRKRVVRRMLSLM